MIQSWWIWYAMHNLLNLKPAPAIVWESLKHDTCVLFVGDKAFAGTRSDFRS